LPSKQLTVKIRANTKDIDRKISRLSTLFNKLNTASNQVGRNNQLNNNLNQSQNKIQNIIGRVKAWATGQKQVTTSVKSTNTILGSIGSKLRGIASTYLGMMGTKAVIDTTDTLVGAQNRLNYVSADILGDEGFGADGKYSEKTLNATQNALDKMYASSQKVRTSYSGMMSNVSRNMALAGDAFQNNIDNAIRFQEIMAEAYAIGGATAQEMHSSMYQMTQALGAGILAGDELRSVREGAPLAYQAIERFAQGVYGTTESLKELASQGKITSDIVVAAIMDAGGTMDTAFKQTKQTFAQTWDQIKNSAMYAFQPVMEVLSSMLQNAVANGLVQKFEVLFTNVAKILLIIFELVQRAVSYIAIAFEWIASGWEWICSVATILVKTLLTVATVIGGVLLGKLILNLMTTTLVVGSYWAMAKAALSAAWASVKAAVMSAISWMTLCLPLTIIIALLVLIVTVVIFTADSIADAIGRVVGIIASVIAFIWNIIVALANIIISIVEFVLNVIIGGFNILGGQAANLIGNMIGWFLELGKVVTTIIDAIFGTNWTAGLESLRSKVTSWGKTDKAITLKRLDSVSYSDAYSFGYNLGSSVGNVGNLLGGVNLDNIGKNLGLDFSSMNDVFPNADDPAYDVAGAYNMPENLKATADNTGKMADFMELAEEDLEYLRRLADMEWKKEFTTASITVDMSNYNTINGDSDLDGIVTKLSDKLYEELAMLPNGVYS
jgi:tape measure domain-containing protein